MEMVFLRYRLHLECEEKERINKKEGKFMENLEHYAGDILAEIKEAEKLSSESEIEAIVSITNDCGPFFTLSCC